MRKTPEIVYIGNFAIVRLNVTSGSATVVAGLSAPPYRGYADGVGGAAMFTSTAGRGLDVNGTFLIVGDSGSTTFTGVRRIDLATGAVTTLAGGVAAGFQDGPGAQAQFNQINDLVLSPGQTAAYISDFYNNRIRVLNLTTLVVTTLVGNGTAANVDGYGTTTASLLSPGQIGLSADGTYLFIMCGNRYLRALYFPTMQLRTLASMATATFSYMAPSLYDNNLIYVSNTYRVLAIAPFSYVGSSQTTPIVGNGNNAAVDGPALGTGSLSQLVYLSLVNETPPASGGNSNFLCSACASCPSGQFTVCNSTATGCSACSVCGAGLYASVTCGGSNDAVCALCPAGSYCPTPGPLPTTCPPGSMCPSTGLTASVACAPGAYANTPGRTACAPAPVGSYVATSAANSSTPCPLGTYSNSTGNTACAPCQPGAFAAATGSAACTPCPAGTFMPLPNASQCLPCPVGTFLPTTGGTACLTCPAGQQCTNASQAPAACAALPSPQAYYVPSATGGCAFMCNPGYYLPQCAACPPNTYCTNSTQFPCPAGTTTMGVTAGSSFLDCVCAPGTFGATTGPTTAACTPCPSNNFCTAQAAAASCACASTRR